MQHLYFHNKKFKGMHINHIRKYQAKNMISLNYIYVTIFAGNILLNLLTR